MPFDPKPLADRLWQAKQAGTPIRGEDLAVDDGRAVLAELTGRAVAAGDEVIGWKIGRIPDAAGEPVFIGAPVFESSRGPRPRPAVAPLLEVEYVAVLGERGEVRSWHTGIEVVDNHAEGWLFTPGWALADWGLHLGVVLGSECGPPVADAPVELRFDGGGLPASVEGAWRTGVDRMFEVLDHDCPRVLRSPRPGDLVWSGALVAPSGFEVGGPIEASVTGAGRVTLDASSFWGP